MKRQSFTQISETFVVCFVEYFDRNIFDTTGGIEDMARIYMIVCKTVWNIVHLVLVHLFLVNLAPFHNVHLVHITQLVHLVLVHLVFVHWSYKVFWLWVDFVGMVDLCG